MAVDLKIEITSPWFIFLSPTARGCDFFFSTPPLLNSQNYQNNFLSVDILLNYWLYQPWTRNVGKYIVCRLDDATCNMYLHFRKSGPMMYISHFS